jgi:hypothetical protein
MVFTDTFKAMPEQFLDALGVTQQMILTNAAAIVTSAKSLTPSVPALPFADRLPDPARISDTAFSYADKVLASQRDFSHKLLEIYAPPKATAPAKASATKSA